MKYYEIELAKKNGTIDRVKSRLVDEKIRVRYPVSEQIAMLRQRDEKPEEFAAFYEYAEACKAEVQAFIDNPSEVVVNAVLSEIVAETAETPTEGEETEGEETAYAEEIEEA